MTYKWRALAFLWVAFFLQQGTRQIFGATLTSIQGALGGSAAEIGMIATVFTFVYGLSVPFAGVAADLLNRKWMVVSGVFVFCLGIFASGFAASLALLLVTYGVLNGFGQSFYYPSATSIIGELHKETRATALSILQMGLYAGIVGCSVASGAFADAGVEGWRVPFWVFGGVGIAWALVLAVGLRGPASRPDARASGQSSTLKEAFLVFVANPSALLLALGLGMMIYVDVGRRAERRAVALHLCLRRCHARCPRLRQAGQSPPGRQDGNEHRRPCARRAVHRLDGLRAIAPHLRNRHGALWGVSRRV